MRAALLLVDLQQDFLARAGLTPSPAELTPRAARLLNACRGLGITVFHGHTLVAEDGTDRMPHWQRNRIWACVAGTPGARPPPALAPVGGECVFSKRYFSAFGNPGLHAELRRREVDTLIVGGLYLHGCIRATVLDAYERGYRVWVAEDAVGTTEPLHGEVTRDYLEGRAAAFFPSATILKRLGPTPSPGTLPVNAVPGICISNHWQAGDARDLPQDFLEHRNPSNQTQILSEVPLARHADVRKACAAALEAWPAWRRSTSPLRLQLLESWAAILRARSAELVDLLAVEIGKPIAYGQEELHRALAHIETALRLCSTDTAPGNAPAVRVRDRAVGVVGLITPWNNPVAIPIGKLAPALVLGNAVVWKPAPRAARIAKVVMDSLIQAGLPAGVVNLVFGDGATARHLAADAGVSAIALTGSLGTGRSVAALCALHGKPLQAELGGNNAAIVLEDCNLDQVIPGLARAAFGFAGQRCTATRRFIVDTTIAAEFERRLAAAVSALKVGDPRDAETHVGPVLCAGRRAQIQGALDQALANGAELVYGGGDVPAALAPGCWMVPALVRGAAPDSAIVQEESFGPVAVILPFAGLDEAIALANGVPHGLVASVHTTRAAARERLAEALEVGVLQLTSGPLPVHPEAPFGGWKASGIGPPEHGTWDRQFYARPQALYGGGGNDPRGREE